MTRGWSWGENQLELKAVPLLTNYVTKSGDKEVASLLAGALK